MDRNVFLSILAMDSYHRAELTLPRMLGGNIGGALQIGRFEDGEFAAVAYNWGGETIISYRGTDNADFFDIRSDVWSGWVNGAGIVAPGSQAWQAIEFYKTVTGKPDIFSGAATNTTLVGHSLGGGLAGLISSISGTQSAIFDHMSYAPPAAAISLAQFNLPPGVAPGVAFYVEGEVNVLVRALAPVAAAIVYSLPPSTPAVGATIGAYAAAVEAAQQNEQLPTFGGLRDVVDLHDPGLLSILLYASASGLTQWQSQGRPLMDALFNDAVANAVGINSVGGFKASLQLLRMIAYSALDTSTGSADVRPFGDAGIRSMFDDANQLGVASGAATAVRSFAKPLAEVLVQYAGHVAAQDTESSARPDVLTGAISIDGTVQTLTVSFADAFWSSVNGGAKPAKITGRDTLLQTALGYVDEGVNVNWLMYRLWGANDTNLITQVSISTSDANQTLPALPTAGGVALAGGVLPVAMAVFGGGADTINGSSGNDFIYGGAGIDTINGGLGYDLITGGDDGDTLSAGGSIHVSTDFDDLNPRNARNEMLAGGAGRDTYEVRGGELIRDSDGEGKIVLRGKELAGGQLMRLDGEVPYFIPWLNLIPLVLPTSAGTPFFLLIPSLIWREAFQWDTGPAYVGAHGETYERYSNGAGGIDMKVSFLDDAQGFVSFVIEDWRQGSLGITLNAEWGANSEIVKSGKWLDVKAFSPNFAPDVDPADAVAPPPLAAPKGPAVWGAPPPPVVQPLNVVGDAAANTINGDKLGDDISGEGGNDNLNGKDGDDVVDGADGDDTVRGENGNDRLRGGLGRDYLYGGAGNDQLHGGAGIDDLYGDAGADTYRFNLGDGQDLISDSGGGDDQLIFGPGILPTSVTVTQTAGSFVLNIAGGDRVTINALPGGNTVPGFTAPQRFERVVFVDGTVWTYADMLAMATVATAGADTFYGDENANVLNGAGGADTLEGWSGADTLTGGAGNDNVRGGFGDDTYVFARGDGQDTITEAKHASETTSRDVIALAVGIAPADVTLTLADTGRDLVINIAGGTDRITIDNQFSEEIKRVEAIRFADGTVWSYEEMLARANPATATANTIYGDERANTIDGLAGNDTLLGRDGNDTYLFARGGGQDIVNDSASNTTVSVGDTVRLASDILPSQVTVTFGNNGQDLVLNVSGGTDRVTLLNTVTVLTNRIEFISFADGTVWTYAQALEMAHAPTTGGDVFWGDERNNTIAGLAGADTLNGRAGADTLEGGQGADTLIGGAGADAYVYNLGDGQDILDDQGDLSSANIDELRFGAGIAPTSVSVTSVGFGSNAGILLTINASDSVLLKNYFGNNPVGTGNRIERIVFADGTIWTHDVLMARVTAPTAGADQINGDTNANTLFGADGADSLYGGDGDDVLEGGLGDDDIYGGNGHDLVSYASAPAAVTVTIGITGYQNTGGAGSDRLKVGVDAIEGLIGSAFNDTLTGDGGNNTLEGGAGNDTLNGGAGTDTASYAGASTAVTVSLALAGAQNTLGAGSDTLAGFEALLGSNFNDRLTGDANANTLNGGAGADVLDGGAGNDTLLGGAGYDTASYVSASSAVTVNLATTSGQNTVGAGTDTLNSIENVVGSAFNDTLTGSAANNRIEGGAGNDAINGATGVDFASYASASSAVTVSLAITAAQNTLGAGTDTISNTEGLIGSAFNDTLTGNASANILEGGAGNDMLDGGAGLDQAAYWGAASAVSVNLGLSGAQNTSGAGTDTLISIEGLIGSSFNDTLTGDANANEIEGGAGNDVMSGGAGLDTASYAWSEAGVSVSLALSAQQNTIGAGLDTLSGFENLVGSEHADTLSGDASANVIAGGLGNDNLDGGDGNDTLQGGDGDDLIVGGLGNDTIDGGVGVDTLSYSAAASAVSIDFTLSTNQVTGGAGSDTVTNVETVRGSAFNDTILNNSTRRTIDVAGGNDEIYAGSTGDTIIFNPGSGADVVHIDFADSPIISIGAGLRRQDMSVRQVAADRLLLTFAGSTETLTLAFDGTQVRTDYTLSFAIGGTMTGVELLQLALVGGPGSDQLWAASPPGDIGPGYTLDGGPGADTMQGNQGDDIYIVNDAGDVVVEGAIGAGGGGADEIRASVSYTATANIENLTLTGAGAISGTGNALNNVITGNGAANTLDGGDGDDRLIGGLGTDTLIGGAGNDVFALDNASDIVVELTSGGVDRVEIDASYTLGGEVEELTLLGASGHAGTGNALANAIWGNTGANTLNGGFGNDRLDGGAGNDTLLGGDDADRLEGGVGDDILDGGAGVDLASYATATGGIAVNLGLTVAQNTVNAGLDTLVSIEGVVGSRFDDVIIGGAGNDIIDGGDGGSDALDGGAGVDTISYATASSGVLIDMGIAGAQPTSAGGADTLANFENVTGSSFNDMIRGSVGANTLNGGDGDDILDGGEGDDVILGGNGRDFAVYALAGVGVSVDLSLAGPQNTGGAGIDTLTSIENVIGSGFADTLTGDGGANRLDGGVGDDVLQGGDGDDQLDGGAGADALTGGAGVDTASYALSTAPVTVRLALSGAQDTRGAGLDTLTGIENLIGSNGGDILGGDALANVLDGGDGVDTVTYADASSRVAVILGQTAQQDTLGAGLDTLLSIENIVGSAFDDDLQGSDGENVMDGGAGSDTLRGGQGSDTYVFRAGGGVDVVMDYERTTFSTDSIYVDASISMNDFWIARENTSLQHGYVLGAGADGMFIRQSFQAVGDSIARVPNEYIIDFVQFANGEVWTNDDLYFKALRGVSGNQSIVIDQRGGGPIDAGAGNDAINAWTDVNATVVWGVGSGADSVDESGAGSIAIKLTPGVTSDQIRVVTSSAILYVVSIAGSSDSISFGTADTVTLNFADGTVWTQSQIAAAAAIPPNTGQTFTGTAAADTLTGGAGNDTLDGLGGADTLNGMGGDDAYVVDNVGDAVVEAAAGGTDTVVSSVNFTLAANVENLTLTGSAVTGLGNTLANNIIGSAQANTLSGLEGHDVLTGLDGADTLNGGDGDDRLYGGTGADLADGGTGADVLFGGQDDDELIGGLDNDILHGEQGNDILRGGAGDDALYGWTGIDTASYADAQAGVRVDLSVRVKQDTIGGGADILDEIENLVGSAFDDTLSGDRNANQLSGGAGGDLLSGGFGADTLLGGADADSLRGGDGADALQGGDGDDLLSGGTGADTLDGGQGVDRALFQGVRADYSIVTGSGAISIVDTKPSVDGNEGADTLVSVEQAAFRDQIINLSTPIVLDLDGDGVELTNLDSSATRFDWNGDGRLDRTAWVGGGDGMLVYDSDGDGALSGARELSFVDDVAGAASDLAGLRAFDTNGDQSLSGADAHFASFYVWRDLDVDGIVGTGEWLTLEDAGVSAIDLEGVATDQTWDDGEAIVVNTGAFAFAGGAAGAFADVAFVYDAGPTPAAGNSVRNVAADQAGDAPSATPNDGSSLEAPNRRLSRAPDLVGTPMVERSGFDVRARPSTPALAEMGADPLPRRQRVRRRSAFSQTAQSLQERASLAELMGRLTATPLRTRIGADAITQREAAPVTAETARRVDALVQARASLAGQAGGLQTPVSKADGSTSQLVTAAPETWRQIGLRVRETG
ncbi:MAG: hypothetical protein K2P58_15780 [Hyphomonadaceae bacterium]|nr:hypothetical protein [Hyphomonadaceae bacterium]